jgi:hypothetical protein
MGTMPRELDRQFDMFFYFTMIKKETMCDYIGAAFGPVPKDGSFSKGLSTKTLIACRAYVNDLYSRVQGATVTVEQFGAVGNGVANDTAAIQRALDSGARTIIFSQTYLYDQIFIPSDVILTGGGTLIAKDGPTRNYGNYAIMGKNWDFTDVEVQLFTLENVLFDNLTFKTENLNHGIILLAKINNLAITDCVFDIGRYRRTGTWNYTVFVNSLGRNVDGPNGSGVNGLGPKLYDMPIPLNTCQNIWFHRNLMLGAEFNCETCLNLNISDNEAVDCFIPFGVNAYNQNVSITGNTARWNLANFPVLEADSCGFYLGQGTNNVTISGNTVINPPTYGVYAECVKMIVVDGNTFLQENYQTERTVGVQISSTELFGQPIPSSFLVVTNNNIQRFGIGVQSGSIFPDNDGSYDGSKQLYTVISNNSIQVNTSPFSYGVYLTQSRWAQINGNVIRGGEDNSMVASNCSDLSIQDNVIHSVNGRSAILLFGTPYSVIPYPQHPFFTNVTVANNTITNDNQFGYHIQLACAPSPNGLINTRINATFGASNLLELVSFVAPGASSLIQGQQIYSDDQVNSTSTALTIYTPVTYSDATAGPVLVTLPAGQFTGQTKRVIQFAGTNGTQVTPTPSIMGSPDIAIVYDIGKSLNFMWSGFEWVLINSTDKNLNNLKTLVVSGSGALSPDYNTFVIDSSGGVLALSLVNGTEGTRVTVFHTVGANNAVLTPGLFGDGTTITTNAGVAPQSYELIWTTGAWRIISNNGATVA